MARDQSFESFESRMYVIKKLNKFQKRIIY
jgi:hypothetical protein